jgi:hypothetical protein
MEAGCYSEISVVLSTFASALNIRIVCYSEISICLFTFVSALKMEVECYSELSITIYWTTRRQLPGDGKPYDIQVENLSLRVACSGHFYSLISELFCQVDSHSYE